MQLVHTETLFHPGAASTSAFPCVLVWDHGACTKALISTASWCPGSEAFHKVVLVLQQPYTLGTDFVEQKESSCAQRKGFALHTPAQHPSWCLGPFIQEAKAILLSTGPETSLAANVSWTESLSVPSGAL